MRRTRVYLLVLAFGCAFQAAAARAADLDPTRACSVALASDPRFAAIRQKLPLDFRPPNFPMLMDPSFPNSTERRQILAWAQAEKSCLRSGAAYRRKRYPAPFLALAAETQSRVNDVAEALAKGAIPYGTANQDLLVIYGDVSSRYAALLEQYRQHSGKDSSGG